MRFDHCDLFSSLPLEGDLVTGKLQGELVYPQGRQLIGVVQSNPVNVIVLPVQPFHSLPFSLLFRLLLAHFYLAKVLSMGVALQER